MLQHKIPPPLVGLIVGAAMWCTSQVVPIFAFDAGLRWTLIGLLIVTAAVFLSGGGLAFRRAKTTVNPLTPDAASALVTTGIYRFSRNPMYVGFSLLLCAWACYLSVAWLLLWVVAYVLYIQRFQIVPEERALEALFGQAFIDYKFRVRPWL